MGHCYAHTASSSVSSVALTLDKLTTLEILQLDNPEWFLKSITRPAVVHVARRNLKIVRQRYAKAPYRLKYRECLHAEVQAVSQLLALIAARVCLKTFRSRSYDVL